jgi:hypothetical protein
MFCSPFLLLSCLDARVVLGEAFAGTTFPLITPLLCEPSQIFPLIRDTGLFGYFSMGVFYFSSK